MKNFTDDDLCFLYNLLLEELEEIDKNINNKYVDKAYLEERTETIKKILEKF